MDCKESHMSVRVRFLAKDEFRVLLKNSGGVSKEDVEIGESSGEMGGVLLSPYLQYPLIPLPHFLGCRGLSIHVHSEQFN